MRIYALICVVLFACIHSIGMGQEACLNDEEVKLYQLITEYRKSKGLPKIPLSTSLTVVAKAHVQDLEHNDPSHGRCNLHSWSKKGLWSACCYTDNHAKAECMWNKPKELTSYKSAGYEIAVGGGHVDAEIALDAWKKSPGHNQVIINRANWKKIKWNAIGIAVDERYSVVWFGEAADKAGPPAQCK